jgi:hypothetical protein
MLCQRWNPFRVCSASDEIRSAYAQCVIKFVLRMLSLDVHVKTVLILPLAEHARKFVPGMLNVQWNWFLVCSVCNKSFSRMLSMRMLQFSKITQNYQIKCKFWLQLIEIFKNHLKTHLLGSRWKVWRKKFFR